MADPTPSRRGMLGLIAAVPAVALVPVAALASSPDRRAWDALVTDYRRKHAAWSAACDAKDAAGPLFVEACTSLPPEPQQPTLGHSSDAIANMTINEIKAASDQSAHKAAWAEYERARTEWRAAWEAIRQRVEGPAEAHHDSAWSAYADALKALTDYRTPSLRELGEKIEIIAAEYVGCDVPLEYLTAVLADVRRLGRIGA